MGSRFWYQSFHYGRCCSGNFVEFVQSASSTRATEPSGIFPYIIDSAITWRSFQMHYLEVVSSPSIFGLIVTSLVLLALVYIQGIHVDIPIVSTKYRGFTAVYPIKLLYTSNIPVILASALLANAVFMGQMLWANYNPDNSNPFFNGIAQFDPQIHITNRRSFVLYYCSEKL